MEITKKVKVKIEKIGRTWVQAKDLNYNEKAVKVEMNEFFTKEFAKENIGKTVELYCKVKTKKGYVTGYDITMYPIEQLDDNEDYKSTEAYNYIKKKLHWTEDAAKEGKFYIAPKAKENLPLLKGEEKEEIEKLLDEYKEKANKNKSRILTKKIKESIKKWTSEKAYEGKYYVSSFVEENIDNLQEEDREEIDGLLKHYKEIAEENTPFICNSYLDCYVDKDYCKQYIGEIKELNGKYGIVKKAYCYRIKGEDECLHPWGAKYTIQMECTPLYETDKRVIKYKKEQEEKATLKAVEKRIAAERQKAIDDLTAEFKAEFSKDNEVPLSEEELELKNNNKEIHLTGEIVWLNGRSAYAYGKGKYLQIEDEYIWIVTNNGGDGDMWTLNFIHTGGAGAYGYKVLKTEKRMQLIEKLKELETEIMI